MIEKKHKGRVERDTALVIAKAVCNRNNMVEVKDSKDKDMIDDLKDIIVEYYDPGVGVGARLRTTQRF